MTTNTMQLKQINTEIIKSTLRSLESGTKTRLAAETGLSVATCRNILDDLLETGEVIETKQKPSTGGRPSRQFIYNENFAYVCVLYIRIEGGQKILFTAVANMAGTIVHENKLQPSFITLETITGLLTRELELYPGIKTFSLGVPGIVNEEIIEFCDVPELAGLNLSRQLTDELGLPVIIENDVNSTAAGFLHGNSRSGSECLAYIYYPDKGGPGCGIIVNGKIINGASNFAGEVSYLPLGIPTGKQGEAQKDSALFSKLAAETLTSVNCIINPEKIIIAGKMFGENLKNLILKQLELLIPENHMPELLFVTDIHDNFIRGLISLALEELRCGIQLVKAGARG